MKSFLRRQTQAAFSLIELLAVMSVIAVAMTLLVPAFNGIGKSYNLSNAGGRLAALTDQARQHAMANNAMTALVLLTEQASPAAYRAVAVMRYLSEEDRWEQVSRWEVLPESIVVDPSRSTFLANAADELPFTGQSVLPGKFNGAEVDSFAARIFLPNGSLSNPEAPATLSLVEGFVRGGNATYTHQANGGGPANYYNVAIVGTTGRVRVERP